MSLPKTAGRDHVCVSAAVPVGHQSTLDVTSHNTANAAGVIRASRTRMEPAQQLATHSVDKRSAAHLLMYHCSPHSAQQSFLLRGLAQCRQPPLAPLQQPAPLLQGISWHNWRWRLLLALSEAVDKTQQGCACCCCEVRVQGTVRVHEHGHECVCQLCVHDTSQHV